MKWWISLWLVCLGLEARASGADCVAAFRTSYIELARTNDPRYREAAEFYSVYYDYVQGLTPIQNEDHRRVLEFVKRGMESGSLCGPNRHPLTRDQIFDRLIKELRP